MQLSLSLVLALSGCADLPAARGAPDADAAALARAGVPQAEALSLPPVSHAYLTGPSSGDGRLSLNCADPYPSAGDPIEIVAEVQGTAPDDLVWSWSIEQVDGHVYFLAAEGDRATALAEEGGLARVHLEVASPDGQRRATSLAVGAGEIQWVAEDESLQLAIDRAPVGATLILDEDTWRESVLVRRDLRLVGQGASSTSIQISAGVGLTVVSARVVLQGLTLSGDGASPLLDLYQSTLITSRVRMDSARLAFDAESSDIQLENSAVLGIDRLLQGNSTTLTARYSALGWPLESPTAFVQGQGHIVDLESSVLAWPSALWPLAQCVTPCSFQAANSFILGLSSAGLYGDTGWADPVEGQDDLGEEDAEAWKTAAGISGEGLWRTEPGFLRSPEEASAPREADLRLREDADAVDAGAEEDSDPDGSRADVGVYGGPLGNWPDVDNDRDGFSDREGDCDDLDAAVLPDFVHPERCGQTSPLGCATGSGGGGGGLLAALALTARRARRRRTG